MRIPWQHLSLVGLAALAVSACGSPAREARAPEPSFIEASRIIEHAPPPSAEPPSELELASPPADLDLDLETDDPAHATAAALDPMPPARATPRAPQPPAAVVARANDRATRAPDENDYLNSRVLYSFVEGEFYRVYACPWYATDILLEPGEELLGPVAGGDPVRWRLDVATSSVGGVPQKHLIIKPQRAGLNTNLIVPTDRRVYYIRLESLESTFMVSVRWTYPQDDAPPTLALTAAPSASTGAAAARTPVQLESLNFDYAIEVVDGKPSWTPRAVYDDGVHTYLRFDGRLLTGEAPALYVVERDEAQLVNYRVKDTLYIVDRLFDVAELRLGNEHQDVVRIRNRRRTAAASARVRHPVAPASSRPGTPRRAAE